VEAERAEYGCQPGRLVREDRFHRQVRRDSASDKPELMKPVLESPHRVLQQQAKLVSILQSGVRRLTMLNVVFLGSGDYRDWGSSNSPPNPTQGKAQQALYWRCWT